MRRLLTTLLVGASAAVGGGWLALGDFNGPSSDRAAAVTTDARATESPAGPSSDRAVAATTDARATESPAGPSSDRAVAATTDSRAIGSPGFEQPPLPEARPKVVEPVAGRTNREPTPVTHQDEGEDRAPTRPASTSHVKRGAATAITDAVRDATALPNGIALPPLEAPEEVMTVIEAGNSIARTPYKWGGGHGRWVDTGYDCSGSVSYALAAAGLLGGPLNSSRLMRWGRPGPGKWVSVYSSSGHVYMQVAGLRFDTSGARVTGSRWQNDLRSGVGFVARHPPGL